MHYLTVQDMLWINLQVSKRVFHYNFATLEESTFYQYAYGSSRSLNAQASRFLTGFTKLAPFESHNEATAFVGFVSFLRLNDSDLIVADTDGMSWFRQVIANPHEIESAIGHLHADADGHHVAAHNTQTRPIILKVLSDYAGTVSALAPVIA